VLHEDHYLTVQQKVDQDRFKKYPVRPQRIADHFSKILADAGITSGKVLEIGGRANPMSKYLAPGFEYLHLDMAETGPGVVIADITDCPQLETGSFDVILSIDVFEHINRPWLAASEISRLLRPGGVAYTSTIFAWRYHPCPIDYWRFTPACLSYLFSELTVLEAGFDKSERRRNMIGKGGNRVEPDGFGGWRENWRVFHAGQKPLA